MTPAKTIQHNPMIRPSNPPRPRLPKNQHAIAQRTSTGMMSLKDSNSHLRPFCMLTVKCVSWAQPRQCFPTRSGHCVHASLMWAMHSLKTPMAPMSLRLQLELSTRTATSPERAEGGFLMNDDGCRRQHQPRTKNCHKVDNLKLNTKTSTFLAALTAQHQGNASKSEQCGGARLGNGHGELDEVTRDGQAS